MISFFHTHFPGLLSFFSSEVNERFFMFLLVSQRWERDSSRFSQLDQESCRRHILARSRGMHLTYSAVALEVKFIAEGVVWKSSSHSKSSWKSGSTTHGQFPCVHMRMQSCLDTMTEQVCMPCVSYLYVLLWSAGGCTKHFLCSM